MQLDSQLRPPTFLVIGRYPVCPLHIQLFRACAVNQHIDGSFVCALSHSRPIGCPQMTWGRTLENALKSKGISKDSDEWIAVAKDSRSKWRQLTHSNPKPPDACWLKDTSRALHKRTLSPVRLVLKVTHFSVAICHSGVSLYIWGVLTRLDLTRQRAHEPMGH